MVLPLPVWQLREPRMNWRNKCQTHSFTKQRARRARAALSGGEAPVRHARAGGGEGGRRRRRRRRGGASLRAFLGQAAGGAAQPRARPRRHQRSHDREPAAPERASCSESQASAFAPLPKNSTPS
mmetsp:Transcript_18380/g.48510  ORF Transcript_18380/g.48510 Transcript_18380/m.48510 type:complete len:125 (-) Transcript_18380:83-457(-)